MTATLSLALLERAYGRAFNTAQRTNAQSVLDALTMHGFRFGLLQPHRTAQYLAQLMHESGGFQYDREIWGPTPAQKRYEGRKDLGNVQKGDGSKYRGRGPIQVTGRNNYREFSKWAKSIDPGAPNFEASPDKINTDPWEGLSPIWFWSTRDLNRYADRGDIENVTRRINGGLNGYADRLKYYDRFALAFLGYGINDMPKFQKAAGLKDTSGTSGPLTRAALHSALLKLSAPHMLSDEVAAAPVVEEKEVEKPVAVTPPGMDAPWYQSKEILGPVAGGGGAAALSAIGSIPWENLALILVAFGAVGLFLYWRKRVDAAAVEKAAQRVGQ
ncbi:glycoside hydrolase family 19 protein [Shinella sp.]|uniref:glycoside hydrolase family 19 protein n=1 Tax=Shinella sp. TaxID=1870904 RepID=UPI003D2DD7A4